MFDADSERQLLRPPDYTLMGVDPTGSPRNNQCVIRIGVDGELEVAAGPSSGDHYDNTVSPATQS